MSSDMATKPINSRGPSREQWQAQKEKIWNLYRVQGLTHKELAMQMTEIFGCRVTEKMVKDRTTKFGMAKTVKKREYEAIIEKQSLHQQSGDIWIRGKLVKQRDVNRYKKRRKVGESDQHDSPPLTQARDHYAPCDGTSQVGSPATLEVEDRSEPPSGNYKAVHFSPGRPAVLGHTPHRISPGLPGLGSTIEQHQQPYRSSPSTVNPCRISISEIVHPTWPRTPTFHLLPPEESEHSFAESVPDMESMMTCSHLPGGLRCETDSTTGQHGVNSPGGGDEAAATPPPSPGMRDRSEIAASWISCCSVAAKNHPYGNFCELQQALHDASSLFEEMVRRRDQCLLSSIVVFGTILEAHGKEDSMNTLLSHTCEISNTVLGPGHFLTVTINWIVDAFSKKQNRARISLSKLREISYVFEKRYTKFHPYYLTSLFNLAKALDLEQYVEEAEPLLREVVETCSKVFPSGHPQAITAQMNLAGVLLKMGSYTKAKSIMAAAVSSSQEHWTREHPYALECLERKATLLEQLNEPDQIERILNEVLKGRIRSLGIDHRFVHGSILHFEKWLENQGRRVEARTLGERMREWAQKTL